MRSKLLQYLRYVSLRTIVIICYLFYNQNKKASSIRSHSPGLSLDMDSTVNRAVLACVIKTDNAS